MWIENPSEINHFSQYFFLLMLLLLQQRFRHRCGANGTRNNAVLILLQKKMIYFIFWDWGFHRFCRFSLALFEAVEWKYRVRLIAVNAFICLLACCNIIAVRWVVLVRVAVTPFCAHCGSDDDENLFRCVNHVRDVLRILSYSPITTLQLIYGLAKMRMPKPIFTIWHIIAVLSDYRSEEIGISVQLRRCQIISWIMNNFLGQFTYGGRRQTARNYVKHFDSAKWVDDSRLLQIWTPFQQIHLQAGCKQLLFFISSQFKFRIIRQWSQECRHIFSHSF